MESYLKIRIPITLLVTIVEKHNRHVDRSLESLHIRTKARQLKKEEKLKEYITKQVGEISLETDAIQEQLKRSVSTVSTGKTEIAKLKWEAKKIVPFKEGNIDPEDKSYFIGVFPAEQIIYAVEFYNSYRGYISKSRSESPTICKLRDYIVESFERKITPEREIYFPGQFPAKYAANFRPKEKTESFVPNVPLQPMAVAPSPGVLLNIPFTPIQPSVPEPSPDTVLNIPSTPEEIPSAATIHSE